MDVCAPDPENFRTHVVLWRYALFGSDVLETSALVAEGHPELVPGGAWDRNCGEMCDRFVAYGSEPFRPVRPWAALPWLVEHVVRGHEEWPGL